MKVLTFYLAKDSIDWNLYNMVLSQKDVEQDVIVISARPISGVQNHIVSVSDGLSIPFKVAYSINDGLKKFWNKKYNYFFKIDNDVEIPEDYLHWMIGKELPIVGGASVMLIEAQFFESQYGSRWSQANLDDCYMKGLAYSKGFINNFWGDDLGKITTPSMIFKKERMLQIGEGYCEIGYPFWLILLSFVILVKNLGSERPKEYTVKGYLLIIIGYIIMMRGKKAYWYKQFNRRLTRDFFWKCYLKLKDRQKKVIL